MSNIWAVYNEKGERLLQTENIMKARGFATVPQSKSRKRQRIQQK